MVINITESKAKPNKAFRLRLEASGSDDMELLTALAAALIHRRQITICKTDDPDGPAVEFTPGEVDDES